MRTMHSRIPAAFLALILVGAAVIPAGAADKETRQMMADIRILQEQAQQLQNLLGTLNESPSMSLRTLRSAR